MMARGVIRTASVIIPNLNCPVLSESLGSLCDQAARATVQVEIIVVGLDAYGNSQSFPTVLFIETTGPMWPSVARNIAIKRATGELILCLDADCVPEGQWIARMVEAHQMHPTWSVIGGSIRIDSDNVWALADNLASFNAYLPSHTETIRDTLPTCNVSMRRDTLAQVGFFNERLQVGEDTDWMMRARRLGFALRFDREACVWHRSQRRTLSTLLSHAELWGYHSVRNRLIYEEFIGLPTMARLWPVLLASAPAIALSFAARIFAQGRLPRQYWPTAPLVTLAKLAWCWGAARRLREARPPEPP
jgi:GT2 family glycosyltransferase